MPPANFSRCDHTKNNSETIKVFKRHFTKQVHYVLFLIFSLSVVSLCDKMHRHLSASTINTAKR